MLAGTLRSLAKSVGKNWPEILALSSGRMPGFVYGRRSFSDIPVFCFHEADLPEFAQQLEFLARNKYKTLDGDELLERLNDPSYENDGTEIVLTFDDALTSVWTNAFPLLEKFEYKIMLFVITGLVPESSETRPHSSMPEGNSHTNGQHPLCNWKEIVHMHESGLVDVQSHGVHHSLIATGPDVVDFVNPGFDPYYYGNIHVPVYDDGTGSLVRDLRLGHPVYQSASRFGKQRRFVDSLHVREACANFVSENGGIDFFGRSDWRDRLTRYYSETVADVDCSRGEHESDLDRLAAIRSELVLSRETLEARLRGKRVTHFCYPWFKGSVDSYRIAAEAGYSAVHVGVLPDFKCDELSKPLLVTRLEHEYLPVLPGTNSRGLATVFRAKLNSRAKSKTERERRVARD